ncbi:Phosphorylated carbohydrates phosphatase [Planctomycetales bacterium 10988]|nr:Phosphorylated carbohydrates phosphatase [Planctomycetales bacterium 10988]
MDVSLAGPRPQAVVFDLDGLMVNTEELHPLVAEEILRERGKTLNRTILENMIGRPPQVALQLFIDGHELTATIEELISETDRLFVHYLDTQLAPMPGLLQLLDHLEAAGLPKAVCTSSRRSFIQDVLGERLGILERFSFVLSAEDVVQGKPDPEIYLTAANRFDVLPEQMVVFEDSHHGFTAAHRAGAVAIAVPGDHSRHHQFEGARFVANTLADPRIYQILGFTTSSGE